MANNKIGQIINDAITVSRYSGIPVLFMGNPGVGKTTHVRAWADANGYELEVLIGSRNTPEEIMGYQVNNGGKSLEHLNPGWWNRVMKNADEGKKTLIFVDELSVCPEVVQGSLLSLICDRENSEGEKLPEGTLIVAAANYAGNLPSMMNIISPTVNRFAIVNVLDGMNNLEILEEFLTDQPVVKQHEYAELAAEKIADIKSDVLTFFKNLLTTYSDRDSSRGWLDFHNADLGNVYQDSVGSLYNLMTPRSCSYLQRLITTCVATKITEKQVVADLANGLIGGGTNNFNDDKQGEKFRKTVANSVISLIGKHVKSTSAAEKKDFESTKLSDQIHEFMMNRESAEDLTGSVLSGVKEIYDNAKAKYGNVIDVAQKLENVNQLQAAAYCADIEALQELVQFLVSNDEKYAEVENLVKIHQDNYYLYCNLIGANCDLKEMKSVYGVYTPKMVNKIVVLKLKSSARQPAGYYKAGVRISGKQWLAFKMGEDESALKVSLANSIFKDDIESTINPKIVA